MGVSLLDQADRLQHALLPKLAQAICALVHPGRQARIRLDALDEEVVHVAIRVEGCEQLSETKAMALGERSRATRSASQGERRAGRGWGARRGAAAADAGGAGTAATDAAAASAVTVQAQLGAQLGCLSLDERVQRRGELIAVLVDEPHSRVLDAAVEVSELEALVWREGTQLGSGGRGAQEQTHAARCATLSKELLHKALVIAALHPALSLEQPKEAGRPAHPRSWCESRPRPLEQHKERLVVLTWQRTRRPEHRFGHTLGPLGVLILANRTPEEMLVQLLIGVVDQQLLERVGREHFEAEDVQQRHTAAHWHRAGAATPAATRGQRRLGRGEPRVDEA